MEYNSILDLVKEINYQQDFSYEKRVDLFNKYKISTSTKYINPIMLLSEHILRSGNEYYDGFYFNAYGTSHHGAVESAFNSKIEIGKNPYTTIKEMTSFRLVETFRYLFGTDGKEFKKLIMFKEIKETKIVTFRVYIDVYFIPKRGFCFYKWADDFCKDLGFNINFSE